MEILQTIWTALTTPNEGLINILDIPLTVIEIILAMLIFTSILNISTSKKQQLIYILSLSIITVILNFSLDNVYTTPINMLILPFLVYNIFKTNLIKSIFSEIIYLIIVISLETIIAKFFYMMLNITLEEASMIPIYVESISIFIYFIMYIIYRLVKHFNFNINLLDNIDKKTKISLLTNSILGCITIATQFYLIGYYNEILPLTITLLSFISLLTYFFISIYNLIQTTQLQIASQNLEEAQLYNKSLKILHDNVRAFKHDFNNIVQAIGRIC